MSSDAAIPEEDELRSRIHAAAEALLEEEGIDGVQVREVAERAGTSTMGVYSRFGGKAGLLDSLYRHAPGLVDAADRGVNLALAGD